MSGSFRLTFCILLPLTLLFFISACSRSQKIEAGSDPINAVTVAVAKVTRENLARDMELAAEFRPYQEIEVHAKVAGYLKEIYVDVGDRVKKGQVLAVLEIPELADELKRASAAKHRSDAELLRAREEIERSESAHTIAHLTAERLSAVLKTRPNLLAQQEIDEAMARDRMAEAQVSAAKAALAATEHAVQVAKADEDREKSLLAYARIAAPFSGVITKRFADTGAMIQAGTASQTQAMPVVRLSQNDRLRLILPAPESVVPRIHIGEVIRIKVPALDKTLEGTVARFAGKVQSATRTMETEVDVPNPDLTLMPGMYAYAELTLDRRPDALAVPIQAVSGHDTRPTVLVVNAEKKIEERGVRLGIETPTKVEILSGLQENDLVIVGSRSQLKPGQRVEPKIVEIGNTKGEG